MHFLYMKISRNKCTFIKLKNFSMHNITPTLIFGQFDLPLCPIIKVSGMTGKLKNKNQKHKLYKVPF